MIKLKTPPAPQSDFSHKCPVCFDGVETKHIRHRCLNHFGYCGEEPDPKLANFFNLPRETGFGRVIPAVGAAKDVVCDRCNSPTEAICPACHSALPKAFPLENHRTIVLMGGKGTGKSTYLAALTHMLMTRGHETLGYTVEFPDEATQGILKDVYHEPLFERRQCPDQTRPMAHNPTLLQPILARCQGPQGRVQTLSFFDASGQDLAERALLSYRKRLLNADAVFFFLDVESLLSTGETGPAAGDFNLDLQALLTIFRERPTMPSLAFVVPMLDALIPVFPKRSALMRSGFSKDGYREEDSKALSYEIQGYLGTWYGTNGMKVIANNFPQNRFFALSSLGYPPTDQGVDLIASHRILDPLAWVLAQWAPAP